MIGSALTSRCAHLLLAPALCFAGLEPARAQDRQVIAASQEDLFAVPEGSPEELLQTIQKLEEARPPELTLEKVREFQQKQHDAIVEAAERVMAANPDDEQWKKAAISKVVALNHLTRYDETYARRRDAFPEELKRAGHPVLARDLEAFLLERELLESRWAEPEVLEKLLGRVQEFLTEGTINEEDARLAVATARAMQGGGKPELAARAYRELGKLLARSGAESIAAMGATMEGIARRMEPVATEK